MEKKTWNDFKETGLLSFVNRFLHIFGWALVFEMVNDEVKNVYPARVKFRGFEGDSSQDEYLRITEYMKKNSLELYKEISEDEQQEEHFPKMKPQKRMEDIQTK